MGILKAMRCIKTHIRNSGGKINNFCFISCVDYGDSWKWSI